MTTLPSLGCPEYNRSSEPLQFPASFLGAGGRQQLCRAGPAPLLPVSGPAGYSHRQIAFGAALYAPAPPRQPGQNGRPPLKGARRSPLKALLEPVNVAWASAVVAWYDGTTRAVELTSQTAVWYRSGKPPVLIRWVLIRDPQGAFAPQALLCTDPSTDPTQILGVVCAALATGSPPSRRRGPTWAWRPNANGRIRPSPAPRPSCWVSFPGPPWPLTRCKKGTP